ncbi:MAG: hypothetical protein SGPRY_012321, partial [Prymnesium sp.]
LSSDSSSATLRREEVHSFEQRRRLGIPRLGILMSDEMAYALALADKTRRSELIDQLRQLDVFSRLTDVELKGLRDALAYAFFEQGQFVFRQDEESDAFYVILEGKGSLVRVEEPDEYNLGEVVLGTVEA